MPIGLLLLGPIPASKKADGIREGFFYTGWNKPLKGKFSVDTTIKATYENIADVVTPEDGEKPDGYSMVTFELANKGTTEGKVF